MAAAVPVQVIDGEITADMIMDFIRRGVQISVAAAAFADLDLIEATYQKIDQDPYYGFDGEPLLLVAAYAGNASVVEFLVNSGVNVDATMSRINNRSAAILAAEGGHHEVIRHLVTMSDSAKRLEDDWGFNAASMLVAAVLGTDGRRKIGLELLEPTLQALHACGFELRVSGSSNGVNCFFRGIFEGSPDVQAVATTWGRLGGALELPYAKDDGRTKLHHSIVNHDVHIVTKLLQAGFNPNQKDCAGFAPVHYALDQGLISLVQELRKCHADFTVTAPDGRPLGKYVMASPRLVDLARAPTWKGLAKLLGVSPEDTASALASAAAAAPAPVAAAFGVAAGVGGGVSAAPAGASGDEMPTLEPA